MSDLTALVFSEYSAGHDTGSHPENQARLTAVHQHLREQQMIEDRAVYQAKPIDPSAITTVHDEALYETVRTLDERGGGFIDADTQVAPGSRDAALAAAGGAMRAVDLVMTGEHQRVFSLCRPPGHHAERRRQMGFCLFNNIAVAAQYAIDKYGLRRVAIIDWDVHHGNGTQDIFYSDPHVLFCSVHQWPLFPGTGMANERGAGAGEGLTVNVPLPPGSGDDDYESAFSEVIIPAVEHFAPELIFVSAGFDAHEDDPLAMASVSTREFGRLAQHVRSLAVRFSGGRLVLVLEGGYNLRALGESVVTVLHALDSPEPNERDFS